MKKILISVILILCLCINASAQLSTMVTDTCIEAVIDGKTEIYSENEAVLLHVKDSNLKTVHIDEQYLNADGSYKFTFQVNPNLRGGKFAYTVSTVDTTLETGNLLVQDILGMKALIEKTEQSNDAEAIKTEFNNFVYITENEIYELLDKTNMYKRFYQESQKYESLTNGIVEEIMERIILLEAVNQNMLNLLLDENSKFKAPEKIGLDASDISYYNEISANGISNINKNIQGKNFDETDKMIKALKALIYVNAITNNKSMGVGNSDKIITEKYEYLNIDVSQYNALSEPLKQNVLMLIVNSNASDAETFGTAYNEAILAQRVPVIIPGNLPGTPSGGGGGSGGGGSSYAPAVQMGVNDNNNLAYDSGFSDMGDFSWAQEAVSVLRENEIVKGKNDTEFAPYDNVTREEFVTMILRAVPIKTQGASGDDLYEFIKCDTFDTDTVNTWNVTDPGIKCENGVMSLSSEGEETVRIKRYNSSNVLSLLTGDSMEAAAEFEKYKIALKTKMTVLSGKEGYSELALLDGDSLTKVHLVRLQSDGDNTFKVLINKTSAGVNSGITNEVIAKQPYGTMIDVCVLINGNVVDFYINGEKAGSTKYSTGIPTWSSGIKLISSGGTVEEPFKGAFDDMAMYFYKGDTNPEFKVQEAYIADGKVNIPFTTPPSEYYAFSVESDGVKKDVSINTVQKTVSFDYPSDKPAKIKIISAGRDIFGTEMTGDTEFTATMNATSEKREFQDVGESDWFYSSVMKADELDIVNGISDNLFGTGLNITRQDMAVMAFRALRYTDASLNTDTSDVNFTDQNNISDYASEYIKILKKMQILSGYSDGSFNPFGTANRAEAAQLIYKIFSLVN